MTKLSILALAATCTFAARAERVLCFDAQASRAKVQIVQRRDDWLGSCGQEVGESERYFEADRAVELIVLNRRILSGFSVTVDKVIQLAGLAGEIRGIDDAASLSLTAPALLGPPAKGGKAASTIRVEALTIDAIIGQFLDEKNLYQPRITLRQQASELEDGFLSIKADLTDLRLKIVDALGRRTCPGEAPEPAVFPVQACLTDFRDAIRREYPKARYMNSDETKFLADLDTTSRRLADMRRLREKLVALALPATITQIEGNVETFAAKAAQFERNLEVVDAAARGFDLLRDKGRDYRRDLKNAELEVQLKTKLKVGSELVVDETELNGIVKKYAAYSEEALAKAEAEIKSLSGEMVAMRGSAATQKKSARDLLDDERGEFRKIEPALQVINQVAASLIEKVNQVGSTARIGEPFQGNSRIEFSQTGNLRVYYTLSETDGFRPLRFEGPAAGAPAGGAVTPAGAAVNSAAARPVASGSFEVHKFSQATVMAGFVISSLARQTFAVRSRPKADKPTESENYIVRSDRQPQLHYVLGLNWYPGGRAYRKDTFPGALKGSKRWFPGILGGVSMNEAYNYFIGPSFEPVLGITFGGGLHYGRQTELQEGIKVDMTVTGSDAPIRNRMRPGAFGTIGLDLNLFTRIFGKVTGVGK